ncbi:MAG: aminomethyl-transferring glycine dehydrogenase subunit GcvPA [Spirochaetota bacterium]
MAYIGNTDADRRAMLERIGVESVEELFGVVPEDVRFPKLALPSALSEAEVLEELEGLAGKNGCAEGPLSFLGAGAYNRFVPSVVPYLASRGEFVTAYTPYQPEASQGTLQALFEYQTMVADLTGMHVVNASHYDAATSVAEAALMSIHISRDKRRRVVVSPGLHPEYVETARTYLQAMDAEVVGDEQDAEGEYADPMRLAELADENTACVVVQYPDFFGRLYSLEGVAKAVHAKGALLVVHIDPIALGLFRSPGSYGADLVTGEGQPLGMPLSYGGPYLGIFACRREYVRRLPGRLAGRTVDTEGRQGFVLTLSTREQHIRREKATSNICTNQGLMALHAALYLAAMGRRGLKTVAELSYHRSHYAASQLATIDGFSARTDVPFFSEFVLDTPMEAERIISRACKKGVVPGFDLGRYYPARKNQLLVCVTEMNSRKQIDTLRATLEEVVR